VHAIFVTQLVDQRDLDVDVVSLGKERGAERVVREHFIDHWAETVLAYAEELR
jgi:hypothetical protein